MKKFKNLFLSLLMLIPAILSFAACTITDATTNTTRNMTFGEFISAYWLFFVLGLLLVGWFFFSSSRRKKQMSEGQNMLQSIKPGAIVMTQGGLIGTVVEVKVISGTDKHVVLETGSADNKSYITYDIRAIGMILKPEQLVPRAPAEEMQMPSDEEVQMALNGAAAPKSEDVFAEEKTEAVAEAKEDDAVSPEGKKPAAKKTTAKKADSDKDN